MPQQSLLNDHMGTLVIVIRPPDHMEGREHTEVQVSVETKTRPLSTAYVSSIIGTETDYLDTLVTAVTMAWAYGERPLDVRRAAAGVMKVARQHRRDTEF